MRERGRDREGDRDREREKERERERHTHTHTRTEIKDGKKKDKRKNSYPVHKDKDHTVLFEKSYWPQSGVLSHDLIESRLMKFPEAEVEVQRLTKKEGANEREKERKRESRMLRTVFQSTLYHLYCPMLPL